LTTAQNGVNPMKPRGIRFYTEPVYEVKDEIWYGWPDFYSGLPITDSRFKVLGGSRSSC
jgi:hypothetical protein